MANWLYELNSWLYLQRVWLASQWTWRWSLYGWLYGMLALMGVLFLIGKVPISYNLRNLVVRWKTTLMTAMAFTIVTGLMTMMMAFVSGMYALTESSGQPGNVVVLASGSNDESFSTLAFADVNNIERSPGIVKNAEDKPLASKEIYVVANQQAPIVDGKRPRRRFVQVRGIVDPQIASEVHALPLEPGGNWFAEAGVEDVPEGEAKSHATGSLSYIQAVLGSGIAAELGLDRPDGQPLKVGDKFVLADRTWKVAGVLDSKGSTFDSEIWAKQQIVGELFGKRDSYSTFVVRAADDDQAAVLAKSLKESKEFTVNALTEKEFFSNLEQNTRFFLYAIIGVTIVMSVGGVFGVMNTMFAAISQRIKDIGVLRIMGFKRRQILVSFLLETLCLALVGGLLGCAIGSLCHGVTTKSIVSGGAGGGKTVVLQMRVSIEILAAGMLMSLVMGGIGGLLPALSAMRLRALESLR